MVDYQELVQLLGSEDEMNRQAARMILLALQEAAVNPLGDQLYAGVTDAQGVGILNVVAEIGGPDAMAMLRTVFQFGDERPKLQLTAAEGLLRNQANLSPEEIAGITLFVAENSIKQNGKSDEN